MKKITILALILAVVCVSAFCQDGLWKIKSITGAVEIKAKNDTEYRAAKVGDSLASDTVISTSFKSTAQLALGNSTLTVRPLSTLLVKELALNGSEEKVSLDLRAGRVRAEVNPPSGGKTDFVVRGPNASASVRGTKFDFDGYEVRTAEGNVILSQNSSGNFTPVRAGENGRVDDATMRIVTPAENKYDDVRAHVPASFIPGDLVGARVGFGSSGNAAENTSSTAGFGEQDSYGTFTGGNSNDTPVSVPDSNPPSGGGDSPDDGNSPGTGAGGGTSGGGSTGGGGGAGSGGSAGNSGSSGGTNWTGGGSTSGGGSSAGGGSSTPFTPPIYTPPSTGGVNGGGGSGGGGNSGHINVTVSW